MTIAADNSTVPVPVDVTREIERQKDNKALIVIGFFFGLSALFWGGLTLLGVIGTVEAFWNGGVIAGGIALLIVGVLLQPILPFYRYLFNLRRFLETEMKVLFVQDRPEYAALTAEVQELARRAGLPGVRYVGIQKGEMNAFAVGFHASNCAVVLGGTLVEHLTKDELRAVIGHEIGHIVSYDMAGSLMTMIINATILQGILRPIVWVLTAVGWGGMVGGSGRAYSGEGAMVNLAFVLFGLMCVLLTLPLIAGGRLFDWLTLLLDRAHSRSREFRADRIGALLTSREAMANALRRLDDIPYADLPRDPFLAFRFVSPMSGGRERAGLLDTHPPLRARIQAIEAWQPGQL